jgi:hypothetical protein
MSGMSRRAACAALLALAAIAAAAPAPAQDARATTVQSVARDWLALIDRGDYEGSWNAAGTKLKAQITAQRWGAVVNAARGPIGPLARRSALTTSFTRSFPGAPEGDYALVVYRTAFEKKADSDETVTLEHEPDGQWRPIGYAVR